jgi:ankyrin repeat protein
MLQKYLLSLTVTALLFSHRGFGAEENIDIPSLPRSAEVGTQTDNPEAYEYFAVPEEFKKLGWNQLHWVAKSGSIRDFKYLLSHGFAINEKTAHGHTVAHIAVLYQKYDLLKVIIEEKGDIQSLSRYIETQKGGHVESSVGEGDWTAPWHTPLMLAVKIAGEKRNAGSVESVRLLIAGGAEINRVNSTGNCALEYAILRQSLPALKMLINAGAHLNLKSSYPFDGYTALIMATNLRWYDGIDLLLNAEADRSCKEKSGRTAYDFATKYLDDHELLQRLKPEKPLPPESVFSRAFRSLVMKCRHHEKNTEPTAK